MRGSLSLQRLLPLALLALACGAGAAPPTPGVYLADGGDRLDVARDADGLGFSLDVTGANGHTCALDGTLQGELGFTRAHDDDPASLCRTRLHAEGDAIRVEALTPDTCRDYCGARAWFEGDYRRAAPACVPEAAEATRARFLRQYQAKDYANAERTLAALLDGCGKTLFWLDAAQVRTDLALTQYHLGDRASCLRTLAPVLERAGSGAEDVRNSLPPSDADGFLPIARAAWHNAALCKAPPR
ncbi:hypothetical protein [uncultured Xanthomonas sp.]|uniref:hypothetical protein n=1 Tax=uncultured Xanthomonas sp. TaxID=152831 RepID=UPI0025E2EC45|nr:hypothetical protein [uncultured Xanthomonas sp.]